MFHIFGYLLPISCKLWCNYTLPQMVSIVFIICYRGAADFLANHDIQVVTKKSYCNRLIFGSVCCVKILMNDYPIKPLIDFGKETGLLAHMLLAHRLYCFPVFELWLCFEVSSMNILASLDCILQWVSISDWWDKCLHFDEDGGRSQARQRLVDKLFPCWQRGGKVIT